MRKMKSVRLLVVVAAGLSGCASEPAFERPLTRSLELPVSLADTSDGQFFRQVSQGIYPKYKPPREGTYLMAPVRESKGCARTPRPVGQLPPFDVAEIGCEAATGAGTVLGSAAVLAVAVPLLPILVPAILVGKTANVIKGQALEDPKANREKTEHLQEVLSDSVLMRLDETLADSFKSRLGWTRPTLIAPQLPDPPLEHTVELPSIEIAIWKIELLEPTSGTQKLVLCARARAYPTYPKSRRLLQSCRHETWESDAIYSKGADELMLIARLTEATKHLGEAMAEGVAGR